MGKSIKGSQTEKNLMKAFAGESQARNRYTYFSGQARKDGFIQIAQVFEETANQEKEHAKRFFSFLEGGIVEISASFPANTISSTLENLIEAVGGEKFEYSVLYPEFAKVAREEGFEAVAKAFEFIGVAEKQHEKRYRELAKNIELELVFKKEEDASWRCINCGYLHQGKEAPVACPACVHPKAYFEILGENW